MNFSNTIAEVKIFLLYLDWVDWCLMAVGVLCLAAVVFLVIHDEE